MISSYSTKEDDTTNFLDREKFEKYKNCNRHCIGFAQSVSPVFYLDDYLNVQLPEVFSDSKIASKISGDKLKSIVIIQECNGFSCNYINHQRSTHVNC